jgi:hypothetical protein
VSAEDIELTWEEELRADALREDAAFDRQCPATNDNGARCAYTLHTGKHTWEV